MWGLKQFFQRHGSTLPFLCCKFAFMAYPSYLTSHLLFFWNGTSMPFFTLPLWTLFSKMCFCLATLQFLRQNPSCMALSWVLGHYRSLKRKKKILWFSINNVQSNVSCIGSMHITIFGYGSLGIDWSLVLEIFVIRIKWIIGKPRGKNHV